MLFAHRARGDFHGANATPSECTGFKICAAQIATHPVWIAQYDGQQGESERRRLLCYAGRKSPSRQLGNFEIVMLNSSFIKTRRPVNLASLLLSF